VNTDARNALICRGQGASRGRTASPSVSGRPAGDRRPPAPWRGGAQTREHRDWWDPAGAETQRHLAPELTNKASRAISGPGRWCGPGSSMRDAARMVR